MRYKVECPICKKAGWASFVDDMENIGEVCEHLANGEVYLIIDVGDGDDDFLELE